ncbi:alpha/beta fold hydrolase [Paracoccus salsus]|uniref:alpha/beta fold hydrolase n=1 Tax=Paracoccus salsus TaxID=2911061 RepID=UPI001F1FBBA6|nr:alpha/beta hydrolase [Paracoccus salsus]MCF3972295.1 alpha/beta hydrolase [Paracoccus salsus]
MAGLKPGLAALVLLAVSVAGCAAIVEDRADAREQQAERAYPPTGRLLQVNGHRVHAHVEGSGPDLVLIHGASGNTRDFSFDLIGRLRDDYRVIAFDRPGLGWTDNIGAQNDNPIAQAELLRAAADQLGIRRPILLGHSYGGAVAMAWALRDPGGPAAIVLLSGATHPWPDEADLGAFYPFVTSAIGRNLAIPLISAFAPESRADDVVARIFAPNPVPDGYLDHVGIGLSLRRDSFLANARQVDNLKPYLAQMAPRYPGLPQPIEIVHGDRDRTVGLDYHSRRMAAEMPRSRLTVLPGVGHMPHHAAPQEVVDAIDRAANRAGLR